MRKILIILLFLPTYCFSETLDYDYYLGLVKTEIAAQNKVIKTIEKSLKTDQNNVELHKSLVYAETKLKELEDKKESVLEARKCYKELVKRNKELDDLKTKLLDVKRISKEADDDMLKRFKSQD